MDRKFSVGDANSAAYRDNWAATFGDDNRTEPSTSDLPSTAPDNPAKVTGQTE